MQSALTIVMDFILAPTSLTARISGPGRTDTTCRSKCSILVALRFLVHKHLLSTDPTCWRGTRPHLLRQESQVARVNRYSSPATSMVDPRQMELRTHLFLSRLPELISSDFSIQTL